MLCMNKCMGKEFLETFDFLLVDVQSLAKIIQINFFDIYEIDLYQMKYLNINMKYQEFQKEPSSNGLEKQHSFNKPTIYHLETRLKDLGSSVVWDKDNGKYNSYRDLVCSLSSLFSPLTVTLCTLISEGLLSHDNLRSQFTQQSFLYTASYVLTALYVAAKTASWVLVALRAPNQQQHWLGERVFAFLYASAALDKVALSFSGFLLFLDFADGLPLFVPAVLLATLQALFLENYVKKRDPSYHARVTTTTGFVLLRAAALLLSALYASLQSRAVLVFAVLLGTVYLLWLLLAGCRARIHPLPLAGKVLYSAAYIAAVLVLFVSLISSRPYTTTKVLLETAVSVAVLLFFCRNICALRLDLPSKCLDGEAVINLEYLLAAEENHLDRTTYSHTQLLLMGLLRQHAGSQCPNPACLVAASDKYLYSDRSSLILNQEMNGNYLRFKLFLKCLYESRLAAEPQNCALVVSFLQFLYNELDSEYLVCRAYSRYQHLPFGFFERVKIAVILRLLSDRRRLFNQQLFGGQLDIEAVLAAEDQFKGQLSLVRQYLSGQQRVWAYLQNDEIDGQHLRQSLAGNFELLERVSEGWAPLRPFFGVNKAWQFAYYFCQAFLANSELLRRETERMRLCLEEVQSPHRELLFDSGLGAAGLLDRRVLFHFQSLYVHAAHNEEDRVAIVGVSDNVTDLSGFSRAELVGSPIEALMTEDMRLSHSDRLGAWLSNGSSIVEEAFSVRETQLVRKSGEFVRVVKYFKLFISAEGRIQYICLLKLQQPLPVSSVNQFSIALQPQVPNEEVSLLQVQISVNNQLESTISEAYESLLTFEKTQTLKDPFTSNQDNIFLKQDSLSLVEHDQHITTLMYTLRILTTSFILFMIITRLVLSQSLNSSVVFSKSYFAYMGAYRIPMVLGNNYYKAILGIGNQTRVKSQIGKLTQAMKDVIKAPQIKEIVFDPLFNKAHMYTPYMANTINQNLSYNQIDLFYLIAQVIMGLDRWPVNDTGRDFLLLDSYLKPSFDQLMNSTKNTFHREFQANLQAIRTRHIYYLIAFISIILLFLFILLPNARSFFSKTHLTIRILTEIKPMLTRRVQRYYQKIIKQINNIESWSDKCSSKQKDRLKESGVHSRINIEHEVNLNHKVKNFIPSNEVCSGLVRVVVIIFITNLILVLGLIAYKVFIIINVQELRAFEEDGFTFLRYFPTAPIVSLGCLERLYSLTHPVTRPFDPERYADVLASMNLFGQVQYTGLSQSQSAFYQMQANYSFGNPCTYSPEVLRRIDVSVAQCESVLDKVIANGLAAYMRAGSALADDYIRGRRELSVEEINNFSISVSVLSAFVLNAIVTWGNEFIERAYALQSRTIFLAAVLAVGTLLLHVLLVECLLEGVLKREIGFIGKVYRHMFPEALLTREKVVVQELINGGLLTSSS